MIELDFFCKLHEKNRVIIEKNNKFSLFSKAYIGKCFEIYYNSINLNGSSERNLKGGKNDL